MAERSLQRDLTPSEKAAFDKLVALCSAHRRKAGEVLKIPLNGEIVNLPIIRKLRKELKDKHTIYHRVERNLRGDVTSHRLELHPR